MMKINKSPGGVEFKKLVLTGEEQHKLTPDLYAFSSFFYISRAHMQNELETVRKWAEEIKLVAPDLYQSFIDTFRK